jgi:hypothetical protein
MIIMFVCDQGKPSKIAEMESNISNSGNKGNFDSRTDAIAGLRIFDNLVLRLLHYKQSGGWKASLLEPANAKVELSTTSGSEELQQPLL